MTDVLCFEVPGEPVPKGRARSRVVTTREGKSFAAHYTPAATRAYEEKVRLLCQVAASGQRWLWAAKDRFDLVIHVHRTHEGRGGDLDNYVKAILDGANGIAFADDRYVRHVSVTLYVNRENPHVDVAIRRRRLGEGESQRTDLKF